MKKLILALSLLSLYVSPALAAYKDAPNVSRATGTLAVPNGGTGATSLTGYLKGTGTAAISAASTIPATDLTGTVAVENGGTGASALGSTISNSGGALNSTTPSRLVTITTDAINPATDAGGLITYNSTDPVAVSLEPATTAGYTNGFGFTVQNKGAGTVTITPTTSTINGTTSLAVPTGTGCAVLSDGSNYNVALCTALGINGVVNSINTQTASYTLSKSDAVAMVRMNCSTSCNLTVPPNSDVPFPVNTTITWSQAGTGSLTLVAGSGVTINKLSTLVASGQYAVGSLVQVSANVWTAFGALQ